MAAKREEESDVLLGDARRLGRHARLHAVQRLRGNAVATGHDGGLAGRLAGRLVGWLAGRRAGRRAVVVLDDLPLVQTGNIGAFCSKHTHG